MAIKRIPVTEFASRRKKLGAALKKGIALIHAGSDGGNQIQDSYRPHPHFEYLTGVTGEPGAVLLLDPSHPSRKRRELLFLASRDPELERWDGARPAIDGALKAIIGIEGIHRLNALPRLLAQAAARTRRLVCVHPFSSHRQPVSPDLAVFRKVAERIPGTAIADATEAMARLRACKSKNEVALIKRAVDITARGYQEVLARLRPGLLEFDVQEILEHAYKTGGSRGPGYSSIAGGGFNSTVLHYRANEAELLDGDLICIDSAATFDGYTSDITRTFPVNGKFTKRQKQIYKIVLKAEQAAIRAVKPGVTLEQLDEVARDVIAKAGFGDAFIHGIGHHLGLEVHDITPEAPLRAGAVITIEPGIYLPDERLGVRIEDDILVTAKGHKNLSSAIPKTIPELEKLLASPR